jgi:hypothetical protein
VSRKLLGALVLAGLIAGCGDDGRIPRAKVVGTVTYRGKPVEKVAVSFFPTTAGVRTGVGKTDAAGKFVLGTYDPDDGAPVGPCKVAFSLRGPPKKLPPGKITRADATEEILEQGDPLIPVRYFDPEKSGILVTVEKGKLNEFTFDLTD